MCTLCNQLDPSKIDTFGERLLAILNSSGVAALISLGHRSGLFDRMAEMAPSTTDQIARHADLNERYVREALSGLLVSGIVEHDPDAKTWWLPAEHAALLTRAASPNNFAAFMQYAAQLGSVEDKVLACFRSGGGVPYSEFSRFHEIMAEDSGQTVIPALFEHIIPLAPDLEAKLEAGADVLDLGCGRGVALRTMAKRYPRSRFLGLDLSGEAVAWANEQVETEGLTNIRYEVADAGAIDLVDAFDVVFTFDAVHDQARPDRVLANIARALRPDGVYLMQDIHASSLPHENVDHPAGPFLYAISTMHCMTVSLAQEGGMGLGTMWGRQLAEKMLKEAGFNRVEVKRLAHDFQNDYYIVRHAA